MFHVGDFVVQNGPRNGAKLLSTVPKLRKARMGLGGKMRLLEEPPSGMSERAVGLVRL